MGGSPKLASERRMLAADVVMADTLLLVRRATLGTGCGTPTWLNRSLIATRPLTVSVSFGRPPKLN